MPDPSAPLPPWLLPHMHTPFRFIDGLGEDMLGYIFPAGNAVGIPTASNLDPSSDDRFGCHHSDDSESTSADAGNIVGVALVRLLDRRGGSPEQIVRGRYILSSGGRSRDPLGGPEIKCTSDRPSIPPVAPSRVAAGRRTRRAPGAMDVIEWPPAARARPRHARLFRRARASRVAGRVLLICTPCPPRTGDQHDRLSGKLRVPLDGGAGGHHDMLAIWAAIGLVGGGMSAIAIRSSITAVS